MRSRHKRRRSGLEKVKRGTRSDNPLSGVPLLGALPFAVPAIAQLRARRRLRH